jgi:hypothetical protein
MPTLKANLSYTKWHFVFRPSSRRLQALCHRDHVQGSLVIQTPPMRHLRRLAMVLAMADDDLLRCCTALGADKQKTP